MKNIKLLLNINVATYFFVLTFLFTGLIKNIILIYVIIMFHELGHIFMIKLLHYRIIKVDIYPMGGVTSINKPLNTPLKHEFLIAVFGPLFQMILFFIFHLFFKVNIISSNTYSLFLNYNLTILIFNLLPIIPLDGYKLLRTLIEIIFPYRKSFYISIIICAITIALFITYNTIYSLNNYLIISFLLFKIITALKDFKYEYLKFQLERYIYNIKYFKIRNEDTLNINLLKKDTYHYFKENNTIISEKKLLSTKFCLSDSQNYLLL